MARLAREAVASIDPDQPVDRFRTIQQVRHESLASPRLTARLLLLFAPLALTITAAGIAGVVAFSVSQRRHEFGIRMALGARPNNVLGLVLRQGLGLVAAGLALGLLGSLGLSRLLSGLLFQIQPHDPATFAAVSLVLFCVAAAACLLPARRATTVDPTVALRTS